MSDFFWGYGLGLAGGLVLGLLETRRVRKLLDRALTAAEYWKARAQ